MSRYTHFTKLKYLIFPNGGSTTENFFLNMAYSHLKEDQTRMRQTLFFKGGVTIFDLVGASTKVSLHPDKNSSGGNIPGDPYGKG
jgi:hypothetical protein